MTNIKQPLTNRWRLRWDNLNELEQEAATLLCLRAGIQMAADGITKYSDTEVHVIMKTTDAEGNVHITEKILPYKQALSKGWFSELSVGVWYTPGYRDSYHDNYKWLLFYNLDKIFATLPKYKA